jgi:hypothetical protein
MRAQVGLAACAALMLAASVSGCIMVFPARTAVTTDPRSASLVYQSVPVYEAQQDPKSAGCPAGSEVRTVFVPQLSQSVLITVNAHLTSVVDPLPIQDPRHFDLTIADGGGLSWVDIHLKNNDTDKKLTIEGPRPGGWTITFNWEICNLDLGVVKVNDNFHVLVVVRQPA